MKRLTVIAVSAALLLLGAGPASARVREQGSCSVRSHYQLTVVRVASTRLKIKFHVTNSPPGNQWQLFGSDNGARVFALKKEASSTGSVFVGRTIANQRGRDAIKAAAYNEASGETCSGSVAL